MDKYNIYYFFKNTNKKLNDNSENNMIILNEIFEFIQKYSSYEYIKNSKNINDFICESKKKNNLEKEQLKDYIRKIIDEIEVIEKNITKDYCYIEKEIRDIVFNIK